MKILFTTMTHLWFSNLLFGQNKLAGENAFGLKLAFDNNTKKLTGYFENYTGWDEESKHSKFSCIFYIEGLVIKNRFSVLTYYPE